jgi:hypothetical protein
VCRTCQDVIVNIIWDDKWSSERCDKNPYAIFTPPKYKESCLYFYKFDLIFVYIRLFVTLN